MPFDLPSRSPVDVNVVALVRWLATIVGIPPDAPRDHEAARYVKIKEERRQALKTGTHLYTWNSLFNAALVVAAAGAAASTCADDVKMRVARRGRACEVPLLNAFIPVTSWSTTVCFNNVLPDPKSSPRPRKFSTYYLIGLDGIRTLTGLASRRQRGTLITLTLVFNH